MVKRGMVRRLECYALVVPNTLIAAQIFQNTRGTQKDIRLQENHYNLKSETQKPIDAPTVLRIINVPCN